MLRSRPLKVWLHACRLHFGLSPPPWKISHIKLVSVKQTTVKQWFSHLKKWIYKKYPGVKRASVNVFKNSGLYCFETLIGLFTANIVTYQTKAIKVLTYDCVKDTHSTSDIYSDAWSINNFFWWLQLNRLWSYSALLASTLHFSNCDNHNRLHPSVITL